MRIAKRESMVNNQGTVKCKIDSFGFVCKTQNKHHDIHQKTQIARNRVIHS